MLITLNDMKSCHLNFFPNIYMIVRDGTAVNNSCVLRLPIPFFIR